MCLLGLRAGRKAVQGYAVVNKRLTQVAVCTLIFKAIPQAQFFWIRCAAPFPLWKCLHVCQA